MPLASPLIQAAAALIPNTMYMRATDTQINTDVETLDLKDKTLILYNNLPVVKNNVTAGVQRVWPVEVKILRLAGEDDDDAQGDLIRAELLPYADLIFDSVVKNPAVSQSMYPTSYDIDFQNVVRIYDDILTGLILKFNIYFDRSFFCVPDEPEP